MIWVFRNGDLHQCVVIEDRGEKFRVLFPDDQERTVLLADCFSTVAEAAMALLGEDQGFEVLGAEEGGAS
jgi:hypothetical protein